MHTLGADWTGPTPTRHNVNIAQGFREPAQYAQVAGSPELTRATYRAYDGVMNVYGQFPGGGMAGDENYRPGFTDPRQGVRDLRHRRVHGQPRAAHEDHRRPGVGGPLRGPGVQHAAGLLDPQGRSIHYITSANSVDLDNRAKTQGQFQNGFAMQAFHPGVDQYRCCPHNYGMGWPYFTEELWVASPDGGLAAAMYAPCTVRAQVAGGATVTVTEDTGYPFTETVTLTVATPRPVRFPLRLRVPGWCRGPELRVNGARVTAPDGPAWASVDRTWRDGDRVTLRLPQRTELHRPARPARRRQRPARPPDVLAEDRRAVRPLRGRRRRPLLRGARHLPVELRPHPRHPG
ncbi:hypothetical protein GCM10020295_78560 [Streptomyces cinereospinus]